MFIVSKNGVRGDVQADVRRLDALARDLKRIAAGRAPEPSELALAPLADQYFVAHRELPCLVGNVEGHPVLGSRAFVSSELWAFAPELGWARTYSRFYRLGRAAAARSTRGSQ